MPRFFFNVRDGAILIEDHNGSDFSGLEDAKEEAIQAAAARAKGRLASADARDVTVEVRDAQGEQVFTATVSLCLDRVSPFS